MKNKPPRKSVSFRLDANLKTKLGELAKAKNYTESNLINLSVHQFLDRNESELTEIVSDKERIAEIILMLQAQYFNKIGHEKYIDELKTFAKEHNISDEDMFKVLTTILECVWNMYGSC